MYIVQVASEIAPIAKIGGLADVMMGLSRELFLLGHEVDIFLPKYDCIDMSLLRTNGAPKAFKSYFEGDLHVNNLIHASYNGDFHISLFEACHPRGFFARGGIYGFQDDTERFLYFSRAILDYLKLKKKVPDIIHIHDWETAAIAVLIREKEFREHFRNTRVIFSIHNMEYQGWCSWKEVEKIGIAAASYKQFEINGNVNLLKGGLLYADYVTTVSPNYAKEVLTPEGGRGLEGVLQKLGTKFCGILNGIDTKFWNPDRDPYIAAPFSSTKLDDKVKNKYELQKMLGMRQGNELPLVVSIARLVPQKGIHLIEHAIKTAAGRYQFVLQGTTQDPVVLAEFEQLKQEYETSPDVRILLQIREDLAHRIYAASDLCLVPSLFEPCGLVQLIALRYGSVPIVRRTGGLLDTITDGENGLCFDYPDNGSINWVIDRALQLWKDKNNWRVLVERCMEYDFSWHKPTQNYLSVYTMAQNGEQAARIT